LNMSSCARLAEVEKPIARSNYLPDIPE